MENTKTPREVMQAVRADFRAQNLNIREAAQRIGTSPATLSSTLARGEYFGRVMGTRLANTFGYDLTFLYTGAGTLRKPDTATSTNGTPSAVDLQLRQILSICVGISAAVGELQRSIAEIAAKQAK